MRNATITPAGAALLILARAHTAPGEVRQDLADFRVSGWPVQGGESSRLATWAEAELLRVGIAPPQDDTGQGSEWWAAFWSAMGWEGGEDLDRPDTRKLWEVTVHGVKRVTCGGVVEVDAETEEDALRFARERFQQDSTLWYVSNEDEAGAEIDPDSITAFDVEAIG